MKGLHAPITSRRREAAELSRSRLAVLLAPGPPGLGPPGPDSGAFPSTVPETDVPAGAVSVEAVSVDADADADADGDVDAAVGVGSGGAVDADLPDGWPHGYGRWVGRRRSTPGPVPASASASVAPNPAAPLDALAAPSAEHTRNTGRFRLRLPGALHSLLWVDRKAALGLLLLLLLAVGYAAQHFWLGRPQAVSVPAATVRPVARSVSQPELARSELAQSESTQSESAQSEPAGQAESATQADPAPPAKPEPAAPRSGAPGSSAPALAPVVVDVAGRVTHPGIRTLAGGSRVADALSAAGGALPGVDTDGLNLARVLVDGEQVLVGAPSPPVVGRPPPSGPKPPVSLNRATLDQLDALPGVGPVLAQHILDFRSSHGPFRSVDQLRQISGIGERKLTQLKPLLTP